MPRLVVGVQDFLRQLGERLAEVIAVQDADLGVLMREAQRAEAVELVQQTAADVLQFLLIEGDRLSAAADTAARAGHDLD